MSEANGSAAPATMKGVDQAEYLRWHDELDDLDDAVKSALADRKNKLAEIKGRIGKEAMTAFNRTRKDRELSGELREMISAAYDKQMRWLGMPHNYQATMDFEGGPVEEQMNESALKRIDRLGMAAGEGGRKPEENPYPPGSEQAQRWKSAWLRGQAKIAKSLGGGTVTELRRGPGRPRKNDVVPPSSGHYDEAPAMAASPPSNGGSEIH